MNQELLSTLLAGIPGDNIGGMDISFTDDVDAIRDARKEDDTSLAQGDWEVELKVADWPKVRTLSEDILSNRSKDLQVAAWYTEAMTKLQGFAGLALGLKTLDGLVTDFWEFCHPAFDPDNLDERIGKIEWLNNQLPMVVKNIPITSRDTGAYSWLKWEESRAVDNLGLKDSAQKEQAVAQGKLSGELFDKAAQASGLAYYTDMQAQVSAAKAAIVELEQHIDEKFGHDAPSLKDLRTTIESCVDLVSRLHKQLGGQGDIKVAPSASPAAHSNNVEQPTASIAMVTAQPNASVLAQRVDTRDNAIKGLRDIANYFRQHEPHSPVAFLAERAAQWAEMPLDKWLSSVIKDESTLGNLNELLGLPR